MAYSFERREGEGPALDAVLRDLLLTGRSTKTGGSRTVHRHLGAEATGRFLRQRPLGTLQRVRDFSQSNDLAAKHPEKLKELQAIFLKEAVKYQVLPLDDRSIERVISSLAGRPDLMERPYLDDPPRGNDGDDGITCSFNVKNRSHTITADLQIPKGGTEGVIACQGGRFGGWSLYTKGGKLNYCYNWVAWSSTS